MIESQFRIASKILILGSDLTSSPWTESYQKNRFGLEKHKKNELILAMLTVQWWMRSVRPGLACCKKLCGRADGADFMDHRSSPRTAKYQLDNSPPSVTTSKSKRRILQCKGEKRTKKAAGHKAMRREGGCCENSGRPVNARHIVAAL